jgi:CRP-like cAMP-binding protein/tetratricopeptide (TPR) repeat protein
MEVSYKTAKSRFSFGSSALPSMDPATAFALESVTFSKPLRPFVDNKMDLDNVRRISDKSAARERRKQGRNSRERLAGKGKLPSLNPSSAHHGRRDILPNQSALHPIPALLIVSFKEPTNLNPAQTHSPVISGGIKDYLAFGYDNCISKLSRAISQTSKSDKRALYISHFLRGLAYTHRNEFSNAVADFTACAKLDKACPLSYFNRGVAHSRLHMRTNAITDFSRAIKRSNKVPDFYVNRALLYRQAGDFASAQKDYATVRQISAAANHDTQVGITDTRVGTNKIEEEILEEARMEAEALKESQGGVKDKTTDDGFFKPIDENSPTRHGSSHRGLPGIPSPGPKGGLARGNSMKSLPSDDNGSPTRSVRGLNRLSPGPGAGKSPKRGGRTILRSHSGHLQEVDIEGSPKKPSAAQLQREKALKTKMFGLVHVALTELPEERTKEQLDLLVAESKLMPAFKHLDAGQLRILWKYLSYRKFTSNVRLFEQGDEALHFYVIWSGTVSARIPGAASPTHGGRNFVIMNSESTVHTMNAGDTLGEAVGAGEAFRKAACVTETSCELLILNQHGFNKTFKIFFERRDVEKMKFLKSFGIFNRRYWEDEELLKVGHYCREVEFAAGEAIANQDDACNAMYFIVTGLVTVIRAVTDGNDAGDKDEDLKLCDVVVTKLCSGEMFGENCVAEDGTGVFQSTIVCETKVKAFRLDKAQMDLAKFKMEAVQKELKALSVTYPDDCVLLQMFLDQKRNAARMEKTMKSLQSTLKKRDRKDAGRSGR